MDAIESPKNCLQISRFPHIKIMPVAVHQTESRNGGPANLSFLKSNPIPYSFLKPAMHGRVPLNFFPPKARQNPLPLQCYARKKRPRGLSRSRTRRSLRAENLLREEVYETSPVGFGFFFRLDFFDSRFTLPAGPERKLRP
jgi:hypothetical protein